MLAAGTQERRPGLPALRSRGDLSPLEERVRGNEGGRDEALRVWKRRTAGSSARGGPDAGQADPQGGESTTGKRVSLRVAPGRRARLQTRGFAAAGVQTIGQPFDRDTEADRTTTTKGKLWRGCWTWPAETRVTVTPDLGAVAGRSRRINRNGLRLWRKKAESAAKKRKRRRRQQRQRIARRRASTGSRVAWDLPRSHGGRAAIKCWHRDDSRAIACCCEVARAIPAAEAIECDRTVPHARLPSHPQRQRPEFNRQGDPKMGAKAA